MPDTTARGGGFDLLRDERLRALLDRPAIFNLSQLAISGGQRATKRWALAWLDARDGDQILDVCCGTGEFAALFTPRATVHGSGGVSGAHGAGVGGYLGVDLNERYIGYARERYGDVAGRAFAAVDATRLRLAPDSFDRALFINSMHHFPDELNRGILREVARVLRPGGRLIVIDMVGDDRRAARRFFLDRDRGEHLRPLAAQLALIGESFAIERHDTFDSGLTPQTIVGGVVSSR